MTPTPRILTAVALAAAALCLPACGGSDTAAPATSATTASTTATVGAGTVSANSASNDELVAAFTAAGIPSAEQWAREVQEYRPYDTSDPTLSHLQDELAKYNPDPAVLAAILATLTP